MTRQNFITQMARLFAAFPDEGQSPATTELWWDELQCIPDMAFMKGVDKIIVTREYPTMPTIGTMLKSCIGDHHRIVPYRKRAFGRDPTLDEIHQEYKRRQLSNVRSIDGPVQQVPAVEVEQPEMTIARLKTELSIASNARGRLEVENEELKEQVKKLEEMVRKNGDAEYAKQMEKRRTVLKQQGMKLLKGGR